MRVRIRRRQFISLMGGAAAAFSRAARAQHLAMPVIGFVNGAATDAYPGRAAAFRKGLEESGYVEGQNVTVEYHWLDGRYDFLPALMADFVRRRVAVIATPISNAAALAAKAATATIPIVFGVGDDPVKLGLVDSLSRPGRNATGINVFGVEVVGKRLALLHELVPGAVRVAVLVNPANVASEPTLQNAQEAARTMGLQAQVLKAATMSEIDTAFAAMAQDRSDALFVAADSFFGGRREQIVTLAARYRIPATYADRESVEAGGLMTYNINVASAFRQVGVYAGKILMGAKPAELPVLQPINFALVVNLRTAKTLEITVPNTLVALADELIE
jgi:putative tryptophan/tyrosine transport system substrate-binding protein